jgi:hypothetical protein
MGIWTLQTERSVITMGIVFCGAGVVSMVGSVCAWRSELRFQAVAVETVATIIPADPPLTGLRIETDDSTVEIRARMRGFHDTVGTKLRIYYVPGAPEHWQRAPLINPSHELILAGGGVLFILIGVFMLVLGWFARQRSGRPFWL